MLQIGAQLYTVREQCQTLENLALTLRKIADIGYRTVQVSGTCAFEAGWLKEQLEKNGLQCVLTHTPADRLTGDTAQVIRDHDVFGCDYVGLGYYPMRGEDVPGLLKAFCETYAPVAKALKAGGKYFMYHNHDQEFQKIGGLTLLEHMAGAFPADEMGFTLDTYWVQVGGGDPAQWLERLAGRIPCIHLKDCACDRLMAPIGEGNINFDRVFEKAAAGGTKYMLVEQDNCNGEDPVECLRRSYQFLRSRGFE